MVRQGRGLDGVTCGHSHYLALSPSTGSRAATGRVPQVRLAVPDLRIIYVQDEVGQPAEPDRVRVLPNRAESK